MAKSLIKRFNHQLIQSLFNKAKIEKAMLKGHGFFDILKNQ